MSNTDMPAHVAHVHTNTEWGGGEYQVLQLVAGLVARGVDTTLWTPPNGALFDRASAQSFPVCPLPRRRSASALRNACHKHARCVLHLHDSRAARIGPQVRRKGRDVTVYSRRIMSPIRNNWLSAKKYAPDRLDAVIAISHAVRSTFLESGYPAERVFVVPSGLDMKGLETAEPIHELRRQFSSARLIGGIGKLSAKKNWAFLVRTAAAMASDHPDIHWAIIGDGPERQGLEQLIRELGVQERVHLCGFIENGVGVLKVLDLLFFPSVMEGASVTVRQAMALGVPVVAVNAAGTVESLDGHGWVIRDGDVPGAKVSVCEALFNEKERQLVCAQAQRSARERFDISVTVDGSMQVYREVLLRNEQRPIGNP